MPRALNLRQIEIFKALIEHGTVSRAAEALYISQPAASKLLMQLEKDNGLKLFDRYKGRLIPTAQGLRLHEEVARIFVGVRQVESAIGLIKREDQGRLVVGVIPALGGAYIQRTTMSFLKRNPNVYCWIKSPSSQWIPEYVLTRVLDIGIVTARVENPFIVTEPLFEHPLLCIMPVGHPLAERNVIRPDDLNGVPFVAFNTETYTGQKVSTMFEKYSVRSNIVLTADFKRHALSIRRGRARRLARSSAFHCRRRKTGGRATVRADDPFGFPCLFRARCQKPSAHLGIRQRGKIDGHPLYRRPRSKLALSRAARARNADLRRAFLRLAGFTRTGAIWLAQGRQPIPGPA